MRLMADIDIPCGCDHRKYIMFTQGKLGVAEGLILATVAAAIIIAKHYGKA